MTHLLVAEADELGLRPLLCEDNTLLGRVPRCALGFIYPAETVLFKQILDPGVRHLP